MSAYEWANWILIISFDLFVVAAAILYFHEKLQVHIQYACLSFKLNYIYQCVLWCRFLLQKAI